MADSSFAARLDYRSPGRGEAVWILLLGIFCALPGCSENRKEQPLSERLSGLTCDWVHISAAEAERQWNEILPRISQEEYDRLSLDDQAAPWYNLGAKYFEEGRLYGKAFAMYAKAYSILHWDESPFLIYLAGHAGQEEWLAARLEETPKEGFTTRRLLIEMSQAMGSGDDAKIVQLWEDKKRQTGGDPGGENSIWPWAAYLAAEAKLRTHDGEGGCDILLRWVFPNMVAFHQVSEEFNVRVLELARDLALCAGEQGQARLLAEQVDQQFRLHPAFSDHERAEWNSCILERLLRSGMGGTVPTTRSGGPDGL